ncbi:MAG: SRPBCC domain-containing protein [Candidatus Latescibacteria bacterium]|nr:SRPBCC domain-containing protein [Candidatus Latescibacterota bacterium]
MDRALPAVLGGAARLAHRVHRRDEAADAQTTDSIHEEERKILMSTDTRRTPTSLTLTRTVKADPERVFDAWTREELLRRWFAPPGYTCCEVDMDPRVGGRYRIAMQKDGGGESHIVGGTLEEIERPRRLVLSWAWEGSPFEQEPMRVTVTFTPKNGETEIVLTHERFADEDQRDSHEKGWSACLDQLPSVL